MLTHYFMRKMEDSQIFFKNIHGLVTYNRTFSFSYKLLDTDIEDLVMHEIIDIVRQEIGDNWKQLYEKLGKTKGSWIKEFFTSTNDFAISWKHLQQYLRLAHRQDIIDLIKQQPIITLSKQSK